MSHLNNAFGMKQIVLAAMLAGAMLVSPGAQATQRASEGSYLVHGFQFFVYEKLKPGFLGVHLGITPVGGGVSGHALLVQHIGGIPTTSEFQYAAEKYLRETHGKCHIVSADLEWLGETRFGFECR